MTILGAQKFLIVSSLGATCGLLIFYVVAPSIGFPLEYGQSIELVQISVPVFLGYVGAATRFIFFGAKKEQQLKLRDSQLDPLLGIIVVGPIVVFAVVSIAVLWSFWWSNRFMAPQGTGMSIQTLSIYQTAALGLLSATTHIAISYLFATPESGMAVGEIK